MPPIGYPGNSVSKAARAKAGGGFESAIEVVSSTPAITGTFAHGNTVTLSDPDARLGTRSNTAFRHWQAGSEIYLNGTQSTAEVGASLPDTTEIWGSFSNALPIVTDRLRHSRVSQQYRAIGGGILTFPQAFDGIGDERKYYLGRWVRSGNNVRLSYVYGFTGLTGTFNTNALPTRGEAITISLVGGGSRTGYILSVSNGFVTYEATPTLGLADSEGAVITGDVSGATLTIDTSAGGGALAPSKISRTYGGDAPGGVGIIATITHQNRIILRGEDALGNIYDYGTYSGARYQDEPDTWHFYELIMDFTGATGTFVERLDNQLIYEDTAVPTDYINPSKGFYLSNVGLDTNGTGVDISNIGMVEEWGEIVADNELKRIVIGNAPTLGACTQIEIQRHTTWAADAVEFVVNQGGFSDLSGKYVFAVDGGATELLGVSV